MHQIIFKILQKSFDQFFDRSKNSGQKVVHRRGKKNYTSYSKTPKFLDEFGIVLNI